MPKIFPSASSRPRRPRRIVRAATAALATAMVFSAMPLNPLSANDPEAEAEVEVEVRPIRLPIPADTLDEVTWTDTWGAPRSSGRTHEGVDMMGPRHTPLLAVADAEVRWSRFSNEQGSLLFLRDAEGWEYAYIHLNNDNFGTDDGKAPCNLAFSQRLCDLIPDGSDRIPAGTKVKAGEVIGFMGDSGNAEHTDPHLHFEIIKPNVGAINPTASVDAARQRVINGGESTERRPYRPANTRFPVKPTERDFVDYVFERTHGRAPSTAERAAFDNHDAQGDFWRVVELVANGDAPASSIDRLYAAFFQRFPDSDGLEYWLAQAGDGQNLETIAELFAMSQEYQQRYGGKEFSAFLDLLYRDVLGREPDASGKRYWLNQLRARRVNIGTIVVYFTESQEMKTISRHRSELVAASRLSGGSSPTEQQLQEWRQLRRNHNLADALEQWLSY